MFQNLESAPDALNILNVNKRCTDRISLHHDEVPLIDYTRLQSSHEVLGSGGNAVVWRGKLDHQTVAVKELFNTELSKPELKIFCREVLLSKVLEHENIVKFHGMVLCPPCVLLGKIFFLKATWGVGKVYSERRWKFRVFAAISPRNTSL